MSELPCQCMFCDNYLPTQPEQVVYPCVCEKCYVDILDNNRKNKMRIAELERYIKILTASPEVEL
jgi:hypothetical protein